MESPEYPPSVTCGGCGKWQTMHASGRCWNCRDHGDLEDVLAAARAKDEAFRREQWRREHERVRATLERQRQAYLDAIGPEAAAKLKLPPRPSLSSRDLQDAVRRLLNMHPHLRPLAGIADSRELWSFCRDALSRGPECDLRVGGWEVAPRWFGVVVTNPRRLSGTVEWQAVAAESRRPAVVPPRKIA
jgi:hypothetical protein